METLIELYDERPIENVLATEVFQPERTVFLCRSDIVQGGRAKKALTEYFAFLGINPEIIMLESSMFRSDRIEKQLKDVIKNYPDCVLDITGGTDAALFAGGVVCSSLDVPAFTYSRRQNAFFSIHGGLIPEKLECTVKHSVEHCFKMAGGALRTGRVDNSVLSRYMKDFDPFFSVYMQNKREWNRAITYMQRATQAAKGENIPLKVDAPLTVKSSNGGRVKAPDKTLRALEKIGFISGLQISSDRVRFSFRDQQIRYWLKDVGSVLELYTYKMCLESGIFNDVCTSAVVDWEGSGGRDSVVNEIDIMAMYGILPVFISCKTCDITTEALNELAILRDRFGGDGAKAIIVSTQKCNLAAKHRASELNIDVIDIEDIRSNTVQERIVSIAKTVE